MRIRVKNTGQFAHRRSTLCLSILIACALLLTATTWLTSGKAAGVKPVIFAGDTCASATIITPNALPFTEDSTTAGASNDIDPTLVGCANGGGADVVYAFTPATTGVYTLGVTPTNTSFDASLYILTDCSNPASCVAGANENPLGKGEFVTVSLSAGTQYFIVVDSPFADGAGPFHFSLRKDGPANDNCATAAVIDPARLPFVSLGTTVGASNDLNPQTPCLRSNQSGRGPDVVYQFTSPDSQNYLVTVTPIGNYDVTVYITTNCATNQNCSSGDVNGGGLAETVRRNFTAGTTYYIVVDGFGTDAGDFNIRLEPTIPVAPPAPTDLRVTAVTSSRVDLAWTDNSNNELGFKVERSFDGQTFNEIATVDPNVTTFSDTTVVPGTLYFYRVFAVNNFGNSAPTNVVDALTPQPPPPPIPVISVSPDSVDFGIVRSMATATVTVSNTGGAALQITDITNPAAPFSIVDRPALPLTIAVGQSIQLTVKFMPTATQSFAGAFVIRSNASNGIEVVVNLRGVGSATPVPNIELPPAVIDFQGGSSVLIFDVKNTGDADLIVSSISTPTAPFALSGLPALPVVLKPGEGFLLSVAFSPSSTGVFQGFFNLISNDPDSLLNVIYLKGTSTTSSEILKLRVPLLVTGIAGTTTTVNINAVNGTNTDIRLTSTAVQGGTFTDRGNGKGDLVLNLPANASGRLLLTFRATDGANRTKIGQSVVNIVQAADTHNVQVVMTAPQTAPGAPTNVFANDQSFTPLLAGGFEDLNLVPQDAAGLTAYLIYRSETPGVQVSAANLVGQLAIGQSSYIDKVPAPAGSAKIFYYVVTALYASGAESVASNETSTAPRIISPRYKKKQLSFAAANSNVGVGAVVIVEGESFPLTRSGDLLIVDREATSTPGGRRQKGFVQSGSRMQIRNPNGAVSATVTL